MSAIQIEMLMLTGAGAVKSTFLLRKLFSKHFGSDVYRNILEKEKVCLVLPSKSGKSHLVQHLDNSIYISIDLDDLSSFVSKEEVDKLSELKLSNHSLYELLYRDIVKKSLDNIKKNIKRSKKKLLCVCGDYQLACYLFKPSSVYLGIPSRTFRNNIRRGLNSDKEKDIFNSSVEDLLQNIHKNRPVLVYNSFQELNNMVVSLLQIQNKI